jgi:hypothetical protein
MNTSEMAAPTPQPDSEHFPVIAGQHEAHSAPQSWMLTAVDAKYHWYDLIAGFPDKPDLHDPVGRYMRRMQIDLEAAAHNHHLLFAVTRAPVRFDVKGPIQWGFFSLKLTLPLLVGADKVKDTITLELKMPMAATLKKPSVALSENFLTLNWGGLVEALSIHDVLNTHGHQQPPGRVLYVGQTFDDELRLSRGRLPALQKLHSHLSGESDLLLLVLRMDVAVNCADGDPADLPQNSHPEAAEALHSQRMDVAEAALIRYFEGQQPRRHGAEERKLRGERLTAVQAQHHLVQFTIDLTVPVPGSYDSLCSDGAAPAPRHLLSCFIDDGKAIVATMPIPQQAHGKKS